MVENLSKILELIKNDKGNLNVFAILKMDEFTDRWTLIVSAPWAYGKESFEYVRKLILENLSKEEIAKIARIGIFQKDTSIIQGLLQYKSGGVISEDTRINGNIIHAAHILESNPNL